MGLNILKCQRSPSIQACYSSYYCIWLKEWLLDNAVCLLTIWRDRTGGLNFFTVPRGCVSLYFAPPELTWELSSWMGAVSRTGNALPHGAPDRSALLIFKYVVPSAFKLLIPSCFLDSLCVAFMFGTFWPSSSMLQAINHNFQFSKFNMLAAIYSFSVIRTITSAAFVAIPFQS